METPFITHNQGCAVVHLGLKWKYVYTAYYHTLKTIKQYFHYALCPSGVIILEDSALWVGIWVSKLGPPRSPDLAASLQTFPCANALNQMVSSVKYDGTECLIWKTRDCVHLVTPCILAQLCKTDKGCAGWRLVRLQNFANTGELSEFLFHFVFFHSSDTECYKTAKNGTPPLKFPVGVYVELLFRVLQQRTFIASHPLA